MAPHSKTKTTTASLASSLRSSLDDDDFQDPLIESLPLTQTKTQTKLLRRQIKPLKPSNSPINRPPNNPNHHPQQKPFTHHGKENIGISTQPPLFHSTSSLDPNHRHNYSQKAQNSTMESNDDGKILFPPDLGLECSLDSIEPTIDCSFTVDDDGGQSQETEKMKSKLNGGYGYSSNSVESRLLKSSLVNCGLSVCENDCGSDDEFEPGTQLVQLYNEIIEEGQVNSSNTTPIHCPLCGDDISDLSDELRQVHTNECLDKEENPNHVSPPDYGTRLQCPGLVLDGSPVQSPRQVVDVSPVLEWLRSLGLARYEEVFVREEIDWDSLQSLTEEDLLSIGVTALGPRKKIIHALSQFRKEGTNTMETHTDVPKAVVEETDKLVANKLITDYFPGHVADRAKACITSGGKKKVEKSNLDSGRKSLVVKSHVKNRKLRDVPLWCSIPGTPFRVDAFKYLRRDCFHWFLTHFHIDHYQGLTRSFCHGKIYCSSITAKLVNLKIGISWDKIQVLPLNQKISIEGTDVTCFDANHCPGAIIILFEPPSGQAVLHTGDFRFSEDMESISILQASRVHTLILDTTYCDPQYDFPKQEAVIQFVIEAIQAEDFNPKTLFLIGSYTIGKERLFLEVARVLRKKVYVTVAKLRILECLGLPNEDMQWLTLNEQESHIHVVPMWTLASFKRLKHISNQYQSRFSLVVAISPTGWTFGKGKKKSPGRRWQQGTIIRYEVPYSEHCSFTELREFVKLVSPVNIIPSVNNEGPESTTSMLSLLSSS